MRKQNLRQTPFENPGGAVCFSSITLAAEFDRPDSRGSPWVNPVIEGLILMVSYRPVLGQARSQSRRYARK